MHHAQRGGGPVRSVNDEGHNVGMVCMGEYRGFANARRGARDGNDSTLERGHDCKRSGSEAVHL